MAHDILLFRSARHLHTALQALRRTFPDARITVVSNAGSEDVLDRAGVGDASRVVGEWTHLSPRVLLGTEAGRSLWRRRRDLVAVLWLDQDGRGYGNVARAALCLSPRGFLVITPDGALTWHAGLRGLAREAGAAARSLVATVLVHALITIPAFFLRAAAIPTRTVRTYRPIHSHGPDAS